MERLRSATWLFFDIGETLMDEVPTNRQWAEVARATLAEEGIEVTREQVIQAQRAAATGGIANPKRGALALLTGQDDDDRFRRMVARGWPLLDEPFQDAPEALTALADMGYRLGVIANQPRAVAEARLEWFGLLDGVEVTLLSGDVGLAKPDPAIFRLALQMAGCEPSEAVMVGDRPDNDIAPARKLGMGTVRVRRGLHADYDPRTSDEEADLTVASLSELVAHIKRG